LANSISVLVPAYNEEPNIKAALESVRHALDGKVEDYEVIVVDDGSVDRTGDLARMAAAKDSRVRVISHKVNLGYGIAFMTGLGAATKEYVTLFPGDNELASSSFGEVVQATGSADMIISYPAGGHKRSLLRRIVSGAYVLLLNVLFGYRLRYYNGAFVFKRSALQQIPIKSRGLTIHSECIVRLLRKGFSYREVPFLIAGRLGERSKAFSLKSVVTVVRAIAILVRDIYFPSRQES
jgi:glycosyltransferase involved in cell wall biosynthesis